MNNNYELDWDQFIQNTIDAMLVCDGEGLIIQANQMAADNLGIALSDLLNHKVTDLINANVYNNSTILKALKEKRVITDTVTAHDGSKSLSTSIPILDKSGNIRFVITNSRTTELLDSLHQKINKMEQANQHYQDAITYLNDGKFQIIADSPQMQNILSYCQSISYFDGAVLINGESGTGKDVVARYIHNQSSRSNRPFIPVNCAAIPRELFESEFFGYASGAFTGAKTKGKVGLFELANKGTVFLDEIGEMPLDIQPKLLRVLETGEFSPVGSNKLMKTDVRVISATNRDLLRLKNDGLFRKDLYYRISVVPITIPPLRHRKEDILALSKHFLEKGNKKYNTKKYISSRSEEVLLDYSWPGNIRELRNVIERAFIISKGNSVEISLEGPSEKKASSLIDATELEELSAPDFRGSLSDATTQFQDFYINSVIQKHGNRLGSAAKELEIHRSTLYRRMNPPKKTTE